MARIGDAGFLRKLVGLIQTRDPIGLPELVDERLMLAISIPGDQVLANVTPPSTNFSITNYISNDLAGLGEIAAHGRNALTLGAGGAGIFGAIGMRIGRDGAGPAISQLHVLAFTVRLDQAYDVYAAYIGLSVFAQQRGRFIHNLVEDTATWTEPEATNLAGPRAGSVQLASNVAANSTFTWGLSGAALASIRRGGLGGGDSIVVYALSRVANVAVAGDAWATWRRL